MRKLLLPISFLYACVLRLRHWCYDSGLLKSCRFSTPIICIGNLNLGGTGKTPHTEYLIQLLKDHYPVAVLSRGYGRKTKGFVLGDTNCNSNQIGDEPMQYLQKHHDITVAVDEDRTEGIQKLTSLSNCDKDIAKQQVILLDDAFQHRKVHAGFNILLTEYNNLFCDDYLLPAGSLRDIKRAAQRADILVVSKSPSTISEIEQDKIIKKLKLNEKQKAYFSTLEYEPLLAMNEAAKSVNSQDADSILLFSGIAHPEPLSDHLLSFCPNVKTITFGDHHPYSESDIKKIIAAYEKMGGNNKIIVTTEKDAARLTNSAYLCLLESIPTFVAPIHVRFIDEEKFNEEILDYVRKNTRDCCISAPSH